MHPNTQRSGTLIRLLSALILGWTVARGVACVRDGGDGEPDVCATHAQERSALLESLAADLPAERGRAIDQLVQQKLDVSDLGYLAY